MKVHLHDEQFDGHLHAACARLGPASEDKATILGEDDYVKVPAAQRCAHCDQIEFPHGGAYA